MLENSPYVRQNSTLGQALVPLWTLYIQGKKEDLNILIRVAFLVDLHVEGENDHRNLSGNQMSSSEIDAEIEDPASAPYAQMHDLPKIPFALDQSFDL